MEEKYVPLGPPEIGMKFDTFEEVEDFLRSYEETNLVKYCKRNNSRTIVSARTRFPKRFFDEKLKYYTVMFTCIHHGENEPNPEGTTIVRKIYRTGCMSRIRFICTPEGRQLIITEVDLEHNHKGFAGCPNMRTPKPKMESLHLQCTKDEEGNSIEPVCPPSMGMLFDTYEEVDKFMREYEEANFVKYFKKDTRTMSQARKRFPKRKLNGDLKYYSVMFACIHERKPKETPGTVQKILRMGCLSRIKFMATPTGDKLALTELAEEHNHNLVEQPSPLIRQQKRHLTEEDAEEACELIKKKGQKMALEQMRRSGKRVSMTDLRNLTAVAQSQHHAQSFQNVQSILDQMSDIDDTSSIVEVVTKEDGRVVGIFFQDQEMRRVYASYPQYLTVDATCKDNDLRMPLYPLLIEDGNGDIEIVAYLLLIASTYENIRSMLLRFKAHNSAWKEIRIVTVDQDFTERHILYEEFPEASVQIPLHSVLRSCEKEVTKDDLKLEQEMILYWLKLIRKFGIAKSEAAYMAIYQQLLNTRHQPLIDYYNRTWHRNRHEWVEGLKSKTLYVKDKSLSKKDKLEFLRDPLKSVFESSPEEVMTHLKRVVELLREERDHSAAGLLVDDLPQPDSSDASQFQQYVTPHAMKYLSRQLQLSWKVKIKGDITEQSCNVKTSRGEVEVKVDSCPCCFWQSLCLPCRHILAVRRFKGLPLFAKETINSRWTLELYKSSCRLSAQKLPQDKPPSSLSPGEKLLHISKVTKQLATVVSEAPTELFTDHVNAIKDLVSIVQSGFSGRVMKVQSEGAVIEVDEYEVGEYEEVKMENAEEKLKTEDNIHVNGNEMTVENTVTVTCSSLLSQIDSSV